jgi:predicted amidohydrolase
MLVAALQLSPLPDAAATRGLIAQAMRSRELEGCRLLVLPEAAQRAIGRGDEPIAPEPEQLDGPFVTLLVGEAARLGATIVAGMFERSGDPARPFNTTVVVGGGGLLASYRKIHLYDALGVQESRGITPGEIEASNIVTVEIDEFILGIQTCFDLRFPEVSRMLVEAGADLLVLGAAWYAGPEKVEQWRILSAARAIESTAYLIGAAQPGPVFCGTSRIVDPRGVLLAEAPHDGSTIITAQLDPEVVTSVRAAIPVIAARRLSTTNE